MVFMLSWKDVQDRSPNPWLLVSALPLINSTASEKSLSSLCLYFLHLLNQDIELCQGLYIHRMAAATFPSPPIIDTLLSSGRSHYWQMPQMKYQNPSRPFSRQLEPRGGTWQTRWRSFSWISVFLKQQCPGKYLRSFLKKREMGAALICNICSFLGCKQFPQWLILDYQYEFNTSSTHEKFLKIQ